MKILGIETSCDETAAAVVEKKSTDENVRLLSNVVVSSLPLHAKTGGIIPETAAREQIKYVIPVINEAIEQCNNLTIDDIDAIAVTIGPGLIGSLLVGVETAKTLAFIWQKPIIPVNHLFGHIYANFVCEDSKLNPAMAGQKSKIEFPAIALVVSGGHTDLVLMKDDKKLRWLGGTRDDAAGEAFDKIGRLLKLPYPGGPAIEGAALGGNPRAFHFPRPMIDSNDFDFSFSGLKASVFREVKTIKQLSDKTISDISASVQEAIVDVLVFKTLKAAQEYKVKSILLGGGVAANQKLRSELKSSIINHKSSIKFFVPSKSLCTDNAAMIATAAFFNYKEVPWQNLTANPELYFD
ncbi:tRNA (adenosine(37)-N6)-threonylcarbamoyltransferase complex transferase subunit TsaD [Patescibacteria group bacterium]|nr:tRNA (adenosine(37)-N6)-threonylcarbamoyltransferase complex transferase subunit TsaD [Patescibacteria group bacterium]